jgi:5-methylcytosine-specific restriction endonuclease McrA
MMKGLYAALPGSSEFDKGKFYLGKLCKNGHEWMNSGMSLRRQANRMCHECINLNARAAYGRKRLNSDWLEHRQSNQRKWVRERRDETGRWSRAKNCSGQLFPCLTGTGSGGKARIVHDVMRRGHTFEEALGLVDDYKTLWELIAKVGRSPVVATLVAEEQARYWLEHPEKKRLASKERNRLRAAWRHRNDPEYRLYHRQKSKRRKALMRSSVGIQLSGKRVRARFAEFGHSCAYCGAAGDLHIEHVVPISKGGHACHGQHRAGL